MDTHYPVLDQGFVQLDAHLGTDDDIARIARVSTGKGNKTPEEDAKFLDYLWRHGHLSPFEMPVVRFKIKMPIFVARQWVRHRTHCLAGDTRLHFDLPGGLRRRESQLYPLTIKEIFDRWRPTQNQRADQQANSLFKRERVQRMMLRSVDQNGDVYHTHIKDVWESGVKPVYRVTLSNGSAAAMSKDHLCLTEEGWRRLEEVVDLPTDQSGSWTARVRFASIAQSGSSVPAVFNEVDEATERWAPVVGWENWYEVSDQGRVRRIAGGKGVRWIGRVRKLTVYGGRAVVSLNRPGEQAVRLVHQLVLEAFRDPRPDGYEALHDNGNSLDNRLENLRWGTSQENSDDMVRHGTRRKLVQAWADVVEVAYLGQQMTYDLEVEGPHHNFSAGGMVVHNSMNEVSGRYVELSSEYYTPESTRFLARDTDNRQASGGLSDLQHAGEIADGIEMSMADARMTYQTAIEEGAPKEMARVGLPLATYTTFFWQQNLRNLLHLLELRLHEHAQWETRQYAEAVFAIVRDLFPVTAEVFERHTLEGRRFSEPEMLLLRSLVFGQTRNFKILEGMCEKALSPSQRREFFAKLRYRTDLLAGDGEDLEETA